MTKRWILPDVPLDQVRAMARSIRIADTTALMCLNRGLQDPSAAHKFLRPSLMDLRDPCENTVLSKAASFLRDAALGARNITIFGDYDADGMCATALLINGLKLAGGDVKATG